MNLTDLRSVVRVQTQTTSADLPDPTIDAYLQQGFERTINGETQWPFYEQTWDVTLAPGASMITIPGDVNPPGIISLTDKTHNYRLQMVAPEFAEGWYAGPQVGTMLPTQYTLWGGQITTYPRNGDMTNPRTYVLRGYRRPLTWLNAANEPDCDARLHYCFTHYACALAYAQQEDEQLESVYMDRWMRDAEAARSAIMDPRHQRPLVYTGSILGIPRSGGSWVLTPP